MHEYALVEVLRAGQVESKHVVSFAVVDAADRLLGSWGDPGLVIFLRSSAKPFQAIPFVESGAAERFGFEARDLALVCASHTGTNRHVDLARRLLVKIDEPESALQCGIHVPYDEDAYERLLRAGEPLEPVRNNCSGKHAGMLGLAKYLGGDLDSYLSPDHHVQQRILQAISEMSAMPIDSIIVGVDGCSAPTFAMPLHKSAGAYARLVRPDGFEDARRRACESIVGAMRRYPELVAGPGKFDTQFMQAVGGRMVSKSGAEGFQAIGIPEGALAEGSPATGIAIKVHDGDDKSHRAAALTAVELVGRLGGFREGERAALANYDARPVRNLSGITIGEIRINPQFDRDFNVNYEWI